MDSTLTSYCYPTTTSSFDHEDLPCTKLIRKKESFFTQSDDLRSPSTDYTEIMEANFYEQSDSIQSFKLDYESFGHSTQFIQALSTFEPLIDSVLQCSIDWEENPKKNQLNQAKEKVKEEVSDADTECEEDEPLQLESWSEKKDKLLKNLAVKCKYDWKKIANKFNKNENSSFSPLILKQKYKELTQVSVPLRIKFTHKEDLMIAKYFEIYGCDWAQIATHFADRTAMMLKNRYYSYIRKRNLLSSMLEEIKETDDNTEVSIETQSEKPEVELCAQNFQEEIAQRFSYNRFNQILFEFDHELSSQLHDKITPFTL